MYAAVFLLAYAVFRPVKRSKSKSHSHQELVYEDVLPGQLPDPNWHYHKSFRQLFRDRLLQLFLLAMSLSSLGVRNYYTYSVSLPHILRKLISHSSIWLTLPKQNSAPLLGQHR